MCTRSQNTYQGFFSTKSQDIHPLPPHSTTDSSEDWSGATATCVGRLCRVARLWCGTADFVLFTPIPGWIQGRLRSCVHGLGSRCWRLTALRAHVVTDGRVTLNTPAHSSCQPSQLIRHTAKWRPWAPIPVNNYSHIIQVNKKNKEIIHKSSRKPRRIFAPNSPAIFDCLFIAAVRQFAFSADGRLRADGIFHQPGRLRRVFREPKYDVTLMLWRHILLDADWIWAESRMTALGWRRREHRAGRPFFDAFPTRRCSKGNRWRFAGTPDYSRNSGNSPTQRARS